MTKPRADRVHRWRSCTKGARAAIWPYLFVFVSFGNVGSDIAQTAEGKLFFRITPWWFDDESDKTFCYWLVNRGIYLTRDHSLLFPLTSDFRSEASQRIMCMMICSRPSLSRLSIYIGAERLLSDTFSCNCELLCDTEWQEAKVSSIPFPQWWQ